MVIGLRSRGLPAGAGVEVRDVISLVKRIRKMR